MAVRDKNKTQVSESHYFQMCKTHIHVHTDIYTQAFLHDLRSKIKAKTSRKNVVDKKKDVSTFIENCMLFFF